MKTPFATATLQASPPSAGRASRVAFNGNDSNPSPGWDRFALRD